MPLQDLFQKDVTRNINGVIKVGQQSDAHVYQELSEYIITKELDRYFNQFFDVYAASLGDPTDKIGVWISGFFGSGKSHFLKILSYLLANRPAEGTDALSLFLPKVKDPVLAAAITRVAQAPADVILFNIDSKADADSKGQKDAIVKVFLKVFNETLGYFGADPAVAAFERHLDQQGKYEAFQTAFEARTQAPWREEREAWPFIRDSIAEALADTLVMTPESAYKLVDEQGSRGNISPEAFAKLVQQYLATKGREHRVLFMVDEVGQYIGENNDLMLNLQTIAEDLGTYCEGRAWVAVTSQEDIDKVTRQKIRGDDFSKIQGRFNPRNRINLSSANTDEVIQLRLLEKTPVAQAELTDLYHAKAQVLASKVRFSSDSANLPGYASAAQFAATYPFLPYQFNLLQKVFTQIRQTGSSGKHLASGERSMLDAFQIAALELKDKATGMLAPFSLFYSAIERFLDTAISQVVIQAGANDRLEGSDIALLKTLFMVKHLKELKANAENLTTLSLEQVDQDRLALSEQIKASLVKLERETLIQRSGDVYSFLTNEEQDIGRQIKGVEIDSGEVTTELLDTFWEIVYPKKEFKLDARHSYTFNRKLDDTFKGPGTHDLTVHVVTSYAERYGDLSDDTRARLDNGSGTEVLVRFEESPALFEEIREYLRTDKFVRRSSLGTLSESLQAILQGRSGENERRKGRVQAELAALTGRADVFVGGTKLELSARDPVTVVNQGLEVLVENTYQKLAHVQSHYDEEGQIARVLREGVTQQDFSGATPNARAQDDLSRFLAAEGRLGRRVTVGELVKKFAAKPFGWAEFDTLGVLAELVGAGNAELRLAQGRVDARETGLVTKLRAKASRESYTLRVPEKIDPQAQRKAHDLARDLLDLATPPGEAQKLFDAYQVGLAAHAEKLTAYAGLAQSGRYPFAEAIQPCLALISDLRGYRDPAEFFNAVKARSDALEDLIDDEKRIRGFYDTQLPRFDEARRRLEALTGDLVHLHDEQLKEKLDQVRTVLTLPDPSTQIPQLSSLLTPVEAHLQAVREAELGEAQVLWQTRYDELTQLGDEGVDGATLTQLTTPLRHLKDALDTAKTIDAVRARKNEISVTAQEVTRQLVAALNAAAEPASQPAAAGVAPPPVRPVVTFAVRSVMRKPLLETEADLTSFLQDLEVQLREAMGQDNRIQLE